MVTVADSLSELYPVCTERPIEMRGFINGNYGSFNRHWFKAQDGDEAPGMGVIFIAAVNGEDTINAWGAAAENGYGFLGWDKTQLVTQATCYAAADLAPVFPFAENPGAYFQYYSVDIAADQDAGTPLHAGATGGFLTADYATKVYAACLYFHADTGAVPQRLVGMVASGGHGG